MMPKLMQRQNGPLSETTTNGDIDDEHWDTRLTATVAQKSFQRMRMGDTKDYLHVSWGAFCFNSYYAR